jgi:hypothetical protein
MLARELVVSVRIVSEVLECHVKAGFLVAATTETLDPLYMLARPPEKIVIADVLGAMRLYGPPPLPIAKMDGEERLRSALDHTEEARRSALERMTLRDLLPANDA